MSDAADDVEPAALQAINALNVHKYLRQAGGIVTMLIATGILASRTRVLPKWLARAGIVIALLVLTPLGFFAYLYLYLGCWLRAPSCYAEDLKHLPK